tara:strand:- start:760 stop:2115 length:1356 start_codon:yes stop_codon:yes gene_type:complete
MLNRITIIFLFILVSLAHGDILPEIAPGDKIKITTVEGNSLTGIVESENETEVYLTTDFGTLTLDRSKIKTLRVLTLSNNILEAGQNEEANTANTKQDPSIPSLNQEARWRTIYSAMLLGNGLYGFGIPFVLGVDDGQLIAASQAFMFGGGFYAAYSYTKNMEIPYGRWQFQSGGAALGGLSIIPLVSMVGPENWSEFDKDGKISMLYTMLMIPYGVIQADKKYNEWQLTNGQASLISGSISWGFANGLGIMSLLYGDDWPDNEIMNRVNVASLYAASYVAPFITRKYIQKKSYTEDDALFIGFSMGLGMLNALSTISLLDMDASENFRATTAVLMGITNGFGYFADSMIKDIDLQRGDLRIISLGTGAAFIIRVGVGILFEGRLPSNIRILFNMAALNSGWYYTFKKVANKNSENSYFEKDKKGMALSLKPIIMNQFHSLVPGIRLQASF